MTSEERDGARWGFTPATLAPGAAGEKARRLADQDLAADGAGGVGGGAALDDHDEETGAAGREPHLVGEVHDRLRAGAAAHVLAIVGPDPRLLGARPGDAVTALAPAAVVARGVDADG